MATVSQTSVNQQHYLPVPLHTLCISGRLLMDVYLWSDKSNPPILYSAQDDTHPERDLSKLLAGGTETVYIPRHQAEAYQAHLENNVGEIVANEEMPMTNRLQFLGDTGRSMLREAFQKGDLDKTMEQVGEISNYMTTLFSENEVVVSELFDVLRHDYHTYTHVYNVASYSLLLAKGLGISDEEELAQISTAGLLHDLGKLNIPLAILNKKARLTDQEWATIQRHPTDGFLELAVRDDLTEGQLMMVYQHHEKIDGTGYPVGVGGDEIHPYARICAVVDIFEALTSNRPYRNPATTEQALEFIQSLSATNKLDAEMVDCWRVLTLSE